MDTRASSIVEKLSEIGNKTKEAIQATCGLPISAYFTAPKLNWLLKNNDLVKLALTNGTCKAGTVDSWIIWVKILRYFLLIISDIITFLLM